MRKSLALILAVGVVAVASGCSSISVPAACAPSVTSGSASDLITASGSLGAAPLATFPTPIFTKSIEATSLTTGKGVVVEKNAQAYLQVTVYDGTTATPLVATSMDPTTPLAVSAGAESNAISEAIECKTGGSRVVAVVPASAIADDAILGTAIPATNPVVLVIDIQKGFIGKADGAIQSLQPGFPTVVTAPDGTPGITFLDQAAPTALSVETLRRGDGKKVKDGDSIVAHLTLLPWPTTGTKSEILSTTWTQKAPATLLVSDLAASADGTTTTGIVAGLKTALVGSTVGSQLVVVVPPKDGYPTGSAPTGVTDDTTLVYVVDVLGIN